MVVLLSSSYSVYSHELLLECRLLLPVLREHRGGRAGRALRRTVGTSRTLAQGRECLPAMLRGWGPAGTPREGPAIATGLLLPRGLAPPASEKNTQP